MGTYFIRGPGWEVEVLERVVITTMTGGEVSDEAQLASFEAADRSIGKLGGRYAVVVDTQNLKRMTPAQRETQAAYIERTKERSERLCAAAGFVVRSPLTRGFLTAVFWLRSPNTEHKVFSSRGAAVEWARNQLAGEQAAPAA